VSGVAILEWFELEDFRHWLLVKSTLGFPKFTIISILGIKFWKFYNLHIFISFYMGKISTSYCAQSTPKLLKWSVTGASTSVVNWDKFSSCAPNNKLSGLKEHAQVLHWNVHFRKMSVWEKHEMRVSIIWGVRMRSLCPESWVLTDLSCRMGGQFDCWKGYSMYV